MLFGKKKRLITRLLLVEDEPLIAFDTEHFLTEEDFEIVATVDRVADAVAVIEGGKAIDLVLVDITLADGSGIEVARVAHERGIAVVFVTGSFPEEAMAFAVGCLDKPYAQRELLAAIAAVDAVRGGGKIPRKLPRGFRLFEKA